MVCIGSGSMRMPLRLVAAAGLLLLNACHPRPETSFDAQQPRTAAVRNIGSFSEALRCMDTLLEANGKRDIYITTAGIPDATGLIAAGTKEMFISAVSRMSARSGAFRFVDYDITQLDVQVLSELVGLRNDFVAPSYYIRGAITQLDSSVLASSQSAGISLAKVDIGVSSDQVVSVISMDLNVGRLVTRQILPGMSANNSIAVVRSGRGADVGGLIGKAGLSFSVSLDKSEGFAQAVRNLVELSTIEVLGKLAQVPYWECLSIEPTNPAFRAEARQWFDLMGPQERNRFIEARAAARRLPDRRPARPVGRGGALPGGERPGAERADRFRAVLPAARQRTRPRAGSQRRGDGRGARGGRAPLAAVATVPVAPPPRRLRLLLSSQPRRAGPVPRRREHGAAHPADGGCLPLLLLPGWVRRDLPHLPQPLPAGCLRPRAHPGGGSARRRGAFSIRFEQPGAPEQIACLAANREVGLLLPPELKRQDLEPLPVRGTG